MRDKDIDPNAVLIPREMTERKRLLASTRLTPPSLSPEEAAELHRFDIMPSNAITNEEEIRRRFAPPPEKTEDDDEHKDNKNRQKKSAYTREPAPDPSRKRYSGACPACGQSRISKVTVTGENYLHLYMEQQKQTKEENERMQTKAQTDRAAEQQKSAEKERELQQIARAHELQDQIVFWRQQFGQGQYDDNTINGMIVSLESELGTIPSGYWK